LGVANTFLRATPSAAWIAAVAAFEEKEIRRRAFRYQRKLQREHHPKLKASAGTKDSSFFP